MDIYQFVRKLRQDKIITIKQGVVIEGINIYVNNSVVYRIAIHVDPAMLKKAKKLGLNNEYVLVTMNEPIKLEEKYSKGKFIIMYDCTRNEASVYEGEQSEREQIQRLKGQ